MYAHDEQTTEEQYLAYRIEHFRKTWKPKDCERDFEREFYYLLETVRRVAQAPLIKQMSAALTLAPPAPIFIEK